MSLGCTSPTAKNYDPSATEDDGSCVWLNNIEGTCYEFEQAPANQTMDHSFTLSMAINQDTMQPEGWVFFHDYFPDAYVHTRDKLLNLKNGQPYFQSKGPKGVYHDSTVHPFFVDVLFAGTPALNKPPSSRYQESYKPYPSLVLNSINWITEVRDANNDPVDDNKVALFLETLTSITIWNQYQTSGKITLDGGNLDTLQRQNNRNAEETWQFNGFRNVLNQITDQFVLSIFQDFRIDNTKLGLSLPWWQQQLMEGKYFIVRFEFDNNNNKQITLHDMDTDIAKSYR